MKIYTNIKLLRNQLNLSQTEFAEKLGMTLRGIQNWEAGKGDVKSAKICLINSIFNVNVNWLLTSEGEMFNDINTLIPPPKNNSLNAKLFNIISGLDDEDKDDLLKYIEAKAIIKAADTIKKQAVK